MSADGAVGGQLVPLQRTRTAGAMHRRSNTFQVIIGHQDRNCAVASKEKFIGDSYKF